MRELFGDETVDYQSALDRHYAEGPPQGWEADYISSYATMHPFEDFAETFAHVMHISDTVDTATGSRPLHGRPVRVLLVPRPRHAGCGCR